MIAVGVDGGATTTRLLALLPDGELIGTIGPGVSPEFFGPEATAEEIARLARRLALPEDSPVAAAFCLAGVDTDEEAKAVAAALKAALPGWEGHLFNDMAAALTAGAPEQGPAVVIASGTGANAGARRPDGTFCSLRAKGYAQGNFGGGYDIVREALHAAFRADEQTGPESGLKPAVLALTGEPTYDQLSQRISENENYILSLIGRLPPLVVELAAAGDQVAGEILARVGRSLAWLGRGAAVQAGLDPAHLSAVVLAGGVAAARSPALEEPFRRELGQLFPMAELRPLTREPVRGALWLAASASAPKDILDREVSWRSA